MAVSNPPAIAKVETCLVATSSRCAKSCADSALPLPRSAVSSTKSAVQTAQPQAMNPRMGRASPLERWGPILRRDEESLFTLILKVKLWFDLAAQVAC